MEDNMAKIQAIPLESLFAADGISPNPEVDPRAALAEAEVVLGIDVMTRHSVVVFGRNALKAIVRTGKARVVPVLGVEIDLETDDLEKLCALMVVVKGRHDYGSAD